MGWKFKANRGIIVLGLRLYMPRAQTCTANLWNAAGNKLASTSIEVAGKAWCEGYFAEPVRLSTDAYYTISTYNSSTRYTANASQVTFSDDITYDTGLYGSTQGAYPSAAESNVVYPIIDLIYT